MAFPGGLWATANGPHGHCGGVKRHKACAVGAYLVAVQLLGLDSGVYFSSMNEAVDFRGDIVGSLLKALVFGALIALVATYRGYTSGRSAEAVGRATTSTVVTASVCILLADYVVTSLWEF